MERATKFREQDANRGNELLNRGNGVLNQGNDMME